VRIPNPYGVLEIDEFNPYLVSGFLEKPVMKEWVNGGYFIFNKKIFDFINPCEELEKEVFNRLAEKKELVAYRHNGFWKSMNSLKDAVELNEMFKTGELEKIIRKND